MDISFLGPVSVEDAARGFYKLPKAASGASGSSLLMTLADFGTAYGHSEGCTVPHRLDRFTDGGVRLWLYRWEIIRTCVGAGPLEPLTLEEMQLEILDALRKRRNHFRRLRSSAEKFFTGQTEEPSRERIPDDVRTFVWQRDEGKCVKCGSIELLEFDHIIPVAEGGSSTERNVQLLCEPCNRKKSDNV
jgi:hypothetical protein